MNNEEKFYSFLESLKTENNETLIESVKEAYELTQQLSLNEANVRGIAMPSIKSPERRVPSKSKPVSPEEIALTNAKLKRDASQAGQGRGRASGSMKQLEKYAMMAPIEVEQWMNTVLKPAIKAGKQDTDTKFGTTSAKVGFGQRLKNVGKAMLGEGQEVAYDDQLDDEDENEEELGGFQSNKQQRREAAQRRGVLKEGQEVDYTDDDPFAVLDDEEDEEEAGGFESNKQQRREAQMKRGSAQQG